MRVTITPRGPNRRESWYSDSGCLWRHEQTGGERTVGKATRVDFVRWREDILWVNSLGWWLGKRVGKWVPVQSLVGSLCPSDDSKWAHSTHRHQLWKGHRSALVDLCLYTMWWYPQSVIFSQYRSCVQQWWADIQMPGHRYRYSLEPS